MRKIIMLLIGFVSLGIHAQDNIFIDAHLGGTTTNFVIAEGRDVGVEFSPESYFVGGVGLHFPLMENLTLRTGVNYLNKGGEQGYDVDLGEVAGIDIEIGAVTEIDMSLLEVPVLVQYDFSNESRVSPYLFGGLTASYVTQADLQPKANLLVINVPLSSKVDLPIEDDGYQRMELGIMGGGGFKISGESGFFFAEVGYHSALNSFITEDAFLEADARVRGIRYQLGYAINL